MLLDRKVTNMAAAIGAVATLAAFIGWIVYELNHAPTIDERVFREITCHTFIVDDGTPD